MRGTNLKIATVLLAAIAAIGLWGGAAWSAEGDSGSADRQPQQAQDGGSGEADGDLPTPVVGTHELMEIFNEPLYEQLQRVMQQEPGDEQWETIEHLGFEAAEIANLVAIRDGEYASEDPQEWREYASALRQAGRDLAQTAETQDFQAARQAYGTLIDRCNACHDHFAPDEAPNLDP